MLQFTPELEFFAFYLSKRKTKHQITKMRTHYNKPTCTDSFATKKQKIKRFLMTVNSNESAKIKFTYVL